MLLKEHNIPELISTGECECNANRSDLVGGFEEILLDDRYAGFIESAFSVSDNYESGLVNDLASFETLCNNIAKKLPGKRSKT